MHMVVVFHLEIIGYVVSVRASAAYYHMLGLDYQRNRNFNNHPRILAVYGNCSTRIYTNFETKAILPSLEALISLNNIMFHSRQSRWNLYGIIGYSALFYKTNMDLEDVNGPYAFQNIVTSGRPRQEIRDELRSIVRWELRNKSITNDRRPDGPNEFNLSHSFTSGVGFEYRIAT